MRSRFDLKQRFQQHQQSVLGSRRPTTQPLHLSGVPPQQPETEADLLDGSDLPMQVQMPLGPKLESPSRGKSSSWASWIACLLFIALVGLSLYCVRLYIQQQLIRRGFDNPCGVPPLNELRNENAQLKREKDELTQTLWRYDQAIRQRDSTIEQLVREVDRLNKQSIATRPFRHGPSRQGTRDFPATPSQMGDDNILDYEHEDDDSGIKDTHN